jgi:nucleoside-diphosphate-sugar epimerase
MPMSGRIRRSIPSGGARTRVEGWGSMARVLIAGCGYVGSALAGRLLDRGDTVWGLKRRPRDLPTGVTPIEADLAVARSLSDLPADLDYVVYAASPSGVDDAHYRAAYVEGLARLLEALDRDGQSPVRVFLLSSTSVYEQSRGDWVDEESETAPRHFSGQRLLEAEGVLRDGPFAATVLRLGGIYGPGRTRLLESVRQGRARYRKGAPRYTNRIHRDDVAAAIVHLMASDVTGRLYLGVDDEPAEQAVVMRWLAGVLGAPEPRPEEKIGARDRSSRSNKRCRNTRLRESGYTFQYPTFREGYGAVIEGMR